MFRPQNTIIQNASLVGIYASLFAFGIGTSLLNDADRIIVALGGVALSAFIWWFFFGKRDEEPTDGPTVSVIVDGGYKPAAISVRQGQPARVTFLRKDPNPCLEEVVFPDYKIRKILPVGTPVTIMLPPPHVAGTFHCGMNMYHGKVVVI
jgi:plastocyanin domain-containing protein